MELARLYDVSHWIALFLIVIIISFLIIKNTFSIENQSRTMMIILKIRYNVGAIVVQFKYFICL